MSILDLRDRKVITASDVERGDATEVVVAAGAVLTPSARDVIRERKLALRSDGAATTGSATGASPIHGAAAASGGASTASAYGGAAVATGNPEAEAAFRSPRAMELRQEILAAGRKLCQRGYVDGNGGNISARYDARWVICTPTLMSKADMAIDDLCMVDLEGVQVAGRRARSSEILLHLAIMNAVPEAQAILHCHPPHATAYAISGVVPPNCIIPEQEVFVGAVALSPYETPGTPAFAETVLPYVKHHNTVLLANHGIVCWADTVTHAEWYAEVVDTYCQTLVIASHLGKGPTQISGPQTAALLDIKKRLGLPDSRFGLAECQLCDTSETPGGITAAPPLPFASSAVGETSDDEIERIVAAVTDRVMAALGSRKG